MPRPALRRRGPNQLQPNSRAAITSPKSKLDNNSSPRQELERKLANKPVAQRLSDSDDSDQLVTKDSSLRNGRYSAQKEIFMSGGVGKGDKPGSYPTRAQRRKNLTEATKKVREERSRSREATAEKSDGSISQSSKQLNLNTKPQENEGPSPGLQSNTKTSTTAASHPGAVQPTPLRENSILGGIKPRKRQPSILHAVDDSTLDITDEDLSLPDLESTPLNLSRNKTTVSTPNTSLSKSSSRKRKLGLPDPLLPVNGDAIQRPQTPSSPEPQLPPPSISQLRSSGQKRQKRSLDEDDILAPPLSSSSGSSPAKPKATLATNTKKPPKAPFAMSTEQLQALMPSRKRKTTRDRSKKPDTFDIPADSDVTSGHSDPVEAGDDSSFLPQSRTRSSLKPKQSARPKAKGGNMTKEGSKSPSLLKPKSTRLLTTPLTGSVRNHQTKSPSQPHILSPLGPARASGATSSSKDKAKQSGGYRLRTTRTRAGTLNNNGTSDKENQVDEEENDESMGNVEMIRNEEKGPVAKVKSKWAEIDAWSMDFEEVEVMTGGSSSPMRR